MEPALGTEPGRSRNDKQCFRPPLTQMANSDPFLHVLVIGAASNHSSAGQIPEPGDVLEFLESRSGPVLFYFIDPAHRSNEDDAKRLSGLQAAGVPLCMVARAFKPEQFRQEYKVMPGDEMLLVDYASIASCEQEWVSLLGGTAGWFYWAPGCAGPRLVPSEAWEASHRWRQHTIYSAVPVPTSLSQSHKRGLLRELDKLLLYSRVLPLDEKDPDPPAWLQEQDALVAGADRVQLIEIRRGRRRR